MPTQLEYALMAGYVYRSTRTEINGIPKPTGWEPLPGELGYRSDVLTGFEATAQKNGSDIVIAFAGTYSGFVFPGAVQDLANDVVLFGGLPAPQLIEAARFYERIKQTYPDSRISFTGHSLGGGLAALMGVFFDKPAVTFNQAPFVKAATVGMALTLQVVTAEFGVDKDLLGFLTTSRATREQNVSTIAVDGEFLTELFPGMEAVNNLGRLGADPLILSHGWIDTTLADRMDTLHAMSLLVMLLNQDNRLGELSKSLTTLLPSLFDKSLFAFGTDGPDRNVVEHLIRHQFGVPEFGIAADGMLDGFTADVAKLVEGGTLSLLNAPIIEALIQGYYGITGSFTRQLLAPVAGGYSLSAADIAPLSDGFKGYRDLLAGIGQTFGLASVPGLRFDDVQAWTIQAGQNALDAVGVGNARDAMLGGTGADRLAGAAGDDLLLGGGGDDALTGGEGNDVLIGGAGMDVYSFVYGDGQDRIVDSDGVGEIWIDGVQVRGGNTVGANRWESDDGRLFFTLEGTELGRQDLVITVAANDDRIVVSDFEPGQLGITLAMDARPETRLIDNIVRGDAGDNLLYGSSANDQIDGLGGNDELRSFGGGEDVAYGGDGDDILWNDDISDTGGDILQGNAGSDIVLGGAASDRAFATNEVALDGAIAAGEIVDATGQRGDWVDGGLGGDVVVGDAGDDALWGGDGADVLIGGSGDDNIGGDLGTGRVLRSWAPQRTTSELQDSAGTYQDYSLVFQNALVAATDGAGGDDLVWAGAGADWVFAGEGDDYVDGGSGADVIFGQAGDDQLVGGSGNDVLGGDDRALPGDLQGDDLVFGNGGDDRIWGGGGSDYLIGGDGADVISGDDPGLAPEYQGADQIDGGAGDDIATGGGGADILTGGPGNDVMVGEQGNDTLFGDEGDDELQGGDGDDIAFGGLGSDRLYGGAGLDRLQGEEGDDYLSGDAGQDTLYGGDGADQLLGGDDADALTGGADDDVLYGDAGDDLLDGGDGNDQLAGGDGSDRLFAGAGDDLLAGSYGGDLLFGASGRDQLFGGDGTDLLSGGDDADELYGNGDDDILLGDAGDDLLHGGDGNDNLFGGVGANLLYGDAGSDALYGDTGTSELHGGDGDDTLAGGAGDERLFGEAGADVLGGGGGADELQGGAGDDRYDYRLGDGADRIFESSDSHGDRIVFGEGIDPQSLRLAQQGSALVFLPGEGFDDQLAVANWFYDASLRVGSAEFADGTAWDETQLAQAAANVHLFIGTQANDTVIGTLGDDTLYGFAGDDVLNGGPGHDVLVGGRGNDTFIAGPGATRILLSPGDGDDTLSNPGGAQVTLQFGDGVNASDLGFVRVDDDLAIAWDEVITIDGWFDGNTVAFEFVDGSVAPSDAEIARAAQDIAQSYAFERGSGTTTLQDWGGSDSVTFGAGILPGDVTAARQGIDLILTVANDGAAADVLVVQGWFDGVERRIEQFRFTDAPDVLTADTLTAPLLDPVGGSGDDSLVSGAGYVETLRGMAGDDTLTARGGGDALIGGVGNDRFFGSAGQETYLFASGDGQDTVQASAGFDTLQFDHPWSEITVSRDGADLVYTFAGNPADSVRVKDYWLDTSRYDLRALGTLRGTDGADTLIGHDQLGDAIYGRAGDDTLSGGGGLDDLHGGLGNDVLDGGLGFDRLYGDAGNDVLGGGYGSDDYYSTAFDGGEGNYYDGGAGDDLYRGNRGRDGYFVGPDNGADVINQAPQLMDGGYYVSYGGDRLIFADGITPGQLGVTRSGTDLVIQIDPQNRVTIQGWFGAASSYYRVDSFDFVVDGRQQTVWTAADVTRLALTQQGTDAADSLTGTADDDALYGLGGDDTLSGLAGSDVLAGGQGDDRLLGGAGDDIYLFGAGDGSDVIDEQAAGSSGDAVHFGAGIGASDITVGRDANALVLGIAGSADRLTIVDAISQPASGVERFVFADGSTLPDLDQIVSGLIDVRGTDGDDVLLGTPGIDRLYGFDGDDDLSGLDDADRLDGGAGNDRLDGGAGNDVLAGGLGDDLYVFAAGHGADSLLDAEGANRLSFTVAPEALGAEVAWSGDGSTLTLSDGPGDKVVLEGMFPETSSLSLSFQDGAALPFDAWLAARQAAGYVLRHTGSAGADVIAGSEGADLIDAGAGDDAIAARGGNDTIFAAAGNDTIAGGAGDDIVYGGPGNDRLDGGAGSDTLSGDAGDDAYALGRGSGRDTLIESPTSGVSLVTLAADTGLADLVIQKQRKDLHFAIAGSGDELVVQNYSSGKTTLSVGLQLAEGTTVAPEVLANQTAKVGSSGNDTVRGGNRADRLYGLEGNDTLLGKGGDDWLSGGGGDDSMEGADGADLYLFAQGWGRDTILESGQDGAIDAVLFGAGVALDSLVFSSSGSDLVVAAPDGSTITVANWYADASYRPERFEDAQGNLLLSSQVDQLVQAMASTGSSKAFSVQASPSPHPAMAEAWLAAEMRWHDDGLHRRPCLAMER